MSRESRLRDGSYEYGADQRQQRRLRRSDHARQRRALAAAQLQRSSTTSGRARATGRYEVEARMRTAAASRATARWATAVNFEPTYFVSDAFSVYVGAVCATGSRTGWSGRHDNLIGSFDETRAALRRRAQLDHRQQAGAAREAAGDRARSAAAPGLSRRSRRQRRRRATTRSTTSACSNLGFQIRYRYELAPLSYLYVVYGRGGFDQEPTDGGARGLLRDSFQLRDDEQLLVKLSYRFEN